MEEKNFESVDEIIDFFENNYQDEGAPDETKEPQENQEESVEPEPDDSSNDNNTVENTDSHVNRTGDIGLKGPEIPSKKHTKEEQREFAFAKLNKERSEALAKAKEYEDMFNDLARMAGYADVDSYKNQLKQAMEAKHAQNQGVSPEVYRKLQQQEAQIRRLNEQNLMQFQQSRAQNFQKALDGVVKEYGFNQDDVNEMFGSLQEAGYTLDTLLQQPNPDLIIRGAFMNKINERAIQSQREKEADVSKGLDTTKHNLNEPAPTYDLDADVMSAVKEYADSMGYKM